jgi:lysophospholipase L1-like esterase
MSGSKVGRAFRAALWVAGQRHSHAIFPLRSVIGFALVLACLMTVAFLVEKELAEMAREGLVSSPAWVLDNKLISRENYKKSKNTPDQPLFHSLGYSPPQVKVGRQRILVIGDSFIWGDGLTNFNLTWWRQVQWELERRGYFDVDVVAAGVNGASTQDEYRWLTEKKLLEKIQPSVVVIGYVTNDADMKDAEGRSLVRQISGTGSETFLQPIIDGAYPNVWSQLAAARTRKLQNNWDQETGFPYEAWELKLLEGENFAQYKALLSAVSRTINQSPAPIFFVSTPNQPSLEHFEARYAPVRIAFKEAGIPLHDLLPALLKCCPDVPGGRLAWTANPANGHPGSKMTHFYATQVADILEKEYPAALGPRSLPPVDLKPEINDWMPASSNVRSVARDAWEFDVPRDPSTLLNMPVENPHLVLSFDRPVSIRSLQLSAPKATDYKVWATVLDDRENYEQRGYVRLGSGKGATVSVQVPPKITSTRITSLRIATGLSEPLPVRELLSLQPGQIASSYGGGYYHPLPPAAGPSDTSEAPDRSRLVLLEDGRPLSFPHALHEEIRFAGNGRYSHWGDGLIFSSSDGTDPRINGRRYSVGLTESTTVRLDIKFNSPAVRQ